MEGYRIEVDKNSYILFEKEEDYWNMFCLDKVFFDFFKIICLIQNEDEDEDRELIIRIKFHVTLIEKYISTLPIFKIKILYDNGENESPLGVKFPYLCYFGRMSDELHDVYGKIFNLSEYYLEDQLDNIYDLMQNLINVRYCRRKISRCYNFMQDYYSIKDYDSDSVYDSDTDEVEFLYTKEEMEKHYEEKAKEKAEEKNVY